LAGLDPFSNEGRGGCIGKQNNEKIGGGVSDPADGIIFRGKKRGGRVNGRGGGKQHQLGGNRRGLGGNQTAKKSFPSEKGNMKTIDSKQVETSGLGVFGKRGGKKGGWFVGKKTDKGKGRRANQRIELKCLSPKL